MLADWLCQEVLEHNMSEWPNDFHVNTASQGTEVYFQYERADIMGSQLLVLSGAHTCKAATSAHMVIDRMGEAKR